MLILKSKLGNITSRFKKNNLPTKEEIQSLTDAEREQAAKSLDTVITDLRSQLESAKAGKPVQDKVVYSMLNSRLKPLSLEEIESRIEELEKINQEFGSSDPLHGQEKFGIKFDIPIEGKTNKEWTIETLTQLYNEMGSNPSVELLYALHYFIDKKTGGQFTSTKGGWVRDIGREISKDNPEPLKEIFKLRLDPDVTNNVDRKVFNYFTNKYKYSVTGIQEIEEEVNRVRERSVSKPGERPTKRPFMESKKVRRKTKGEMVMAEKGSLELLLAPNIADKINRITLTDLRGLITNLNKANAGNDFISALEGPSIDIVYEIINAKGIDNLVREIQVSRKGESTTKSKGRYLTLWAVKYIEERRNEDPSRTITIGDTDIQSVNEMKPILSKTLTSRTPEEQREVNSYLSNINKTLDYLRRQINEDRPAFVRNYRQFISQSRQIESKVADISDEELSGLSGKERRNYIKNYLETSGFSNVDNTDLKYYVDFDDYKQLDYALSSENLSGLSRFPRSILSLLVLSYISSDENDYESLVNKLNTVSGEFRQYIPTGKLFSNNSESTFVDSMRALLTVFKRLLGREELSRYNNAFVDFADKLRDALDELYKVILEEAKEEGLEDVDRLEVLEYGIKEDIFEEDIGGVVNKVKAELDNLKEVINDLLAILAENMISLLITNISDIAEDTEDRYKRQGLKVKGRSAGIREYLISKKYLQIPSPPRIITEGDTKYVISEESKSVNNLEDEVIYYKRVKKNKKMITDKTQEYKFKLRDLLGD
tara:strand:+ start:19244 stop:21553 length:2310 start_codon:yes stop_codon:yes gene_type:complete